MALAKGWAQKRIEKNRESIIRPHTCDSSVFDSDAKTSQTSFWKV